MKWNYSRECLVLRELVCRLSNPASSAVPMHTQDPNHGTVTAFSFVPSCSLSPSNCLALTLRLHRTKFIACTTSADETFSSSVLGFI